VVRASARRNDPENNINGTSHFACDPVELSDPDGDCLDGIQSPDGPYGIGTRWLSNLKCTDEGGLRDSCSTTVTVNDVDTDGVGVFGKHRLVYCFCLA
jgi:hypothetical protein